MLKTLQASRLFRPSAVCTGASWSGRRLLSTTEQRADEETSEIPSEMETDDASKEEPIKTSRRRRRFHEWARGSGAKYARQAIGTTNYLGDTPFPSNPLFKPKPPLADTTREDIYEAYIADPQNRTIRQLSAKYHISLKRVEAVLKLKQSQRQLEANGFVLQSSFAKGMEQYLRADVTQEPIQDQLVDVKTSIRKPIFKSLEEDVDFSAEDAAEVLGRKPFKDMEKGAIRSTLASFRLHTNTPSARPESDDKRHRYLIVDTSK